MPRPLRVDVPDATHHIAALAVEKEVVFRESADRRRFISQLAATISCYGWNCRAYCLMGNHFHLLLQLPQPQRLSAAMAGLMVSYWHHYRRRYGLVGHLFQGRIPIPRACPVDR